MELGYLYDKKGYYKEINAILIELVSTTIPTKPNKDKLIQVRDYYTSLLKESKDKDISLINHIISICNKEINK